MNNSKPKYGLKIEIWEQPKYAIGRLYVDLKVDNSSKEDVRKQLLQLVDYFYESWQRPRDKNGHFLKTSATKDNAEFVG